MVIYNEKYIFFITSLVKKTLEFPLRYNKDYFSVDKVALGTTEGCELVPRSTNQ